MFCLKSPFYVFKKMTLTERQKAVSFIVFFTFDCKYHSLFCFAFSNLDNSVAFEFFQSKWHIPNILLIYTYFVNLSLT